MACARCVLIPCNLMSPLLQRWTRTPYTLRIGSVLFFFVIMAASFYQGATAGPDMRAFLIVVIACVLVITLFLARHVFMGLLLMGVAGSLGWLTDIWGVTNELWTYHGNENSFLELHASAASGGVPIEIVLAYFFSAIWLVQVLESLFDQEHDWMHAFHAAGKKLGLGGRERVMGAAVTSVSVVIVAIDGLYLQPLITFNIGTWLTLFVPSAVRHTSVVFGLIMAISGLFFEMLCTGKLIPDVAIWTYSEMGHDLPLWMIGVFLGYAGSGAIVASAQLMLLRSTRWGRKVELLPHPTWI
jgi:hypothetical protein